MSSSPSPDGSGDDPWVPYAKREEWKDVQPLEQDDGPDPIVRIAYSDRFVDVFNYFRAIYASQEVSLRALKLTEDAIAENAANYTVWHHRRFLLKALRDSPKIGEDEKPSLESEMNYLRYIMEENAKNYQVWQHRREIVLWMNDPSKELRFCEMMIAQDSKNYHCWQHRQWVMEKFKLFDDELDYTARLLDEDVRNNSAWNQRFFVVSHLAPDGQLKGELLQSEVAFAIEAIRKVPDNESSWNYLRGLMDRCEEEEAPKVLQSVNKFCDDLYNHNDERSRFLLGAKVDLIVRELDNDNTGQKQSKLAKAQELCQELAEEHDVMRKEYWQFLSRDLNARFAQG